VPFGDSWLSFDESLESWFGFVVPEIEGCHLFVI